MLTRAVLPSVSALEAARRNLEEGTSPGAGLSAEEAAEAAYADMINTSLGEGEKLTPEQVQQLAEGGLMDSSSTKQKSGGLAKDVANLWNALKGGAHIVKRDDGSV